MRVSLIAATLASGAIAARPFLDEPDTGILDAVGNITTGTLPDIDSMIALNDFEWAARNYLPGKNYTYYRAGAGGEWSYRNNLEVFNRYRFKPRLMIDVTNITATLPTTILGYNFSAPFYISPCAAALYGHPKAERNLVKGAAKGDILYIPSGYSTLSMETIAGDAAKDQVLFAQLYLSNNDTSNQELFDRAEASGYKAVVWTIDHPGGATRQRADRYDVGSSDRDFVRSTWDDLDRYRNMTSLPILLKGIQSAVDARAAVDHGVPVIILSNHGGRNLDGSPSPLEIALDIHQNDPAIFSEVEVLADGGVRYGSDALRLLALGVKAVGLGRPFMFANVYGEDGVRKVADIMKKEIAGDAANLGVPDLKNIDSGLVDWSLNGWYS